MDKKGDFNVSNRQFVNTLLMYQFIEIDKNKNGSVKNIKIIRINIVIMID